MIATAPAVAPFSTSSLANLPLPPSERDFEVYRRTAVEGRTTREAAAEFNISQTRVMQIREKVFEWIGNHLPPLARLEPAERLRVAQTLACEQLQHQYDEAMQAWRTSATAVHVTRYVGRSIEDGVTMVKESQGEPRYLRLATQITKAISKLGMATMPNPETAMPVALQATADESANHPQGDYSESSAPQAEQQPSAASESNTKPESASISSASSERKSASLVLPDDAAQTVQAIVEQLENLPHRERKERKREAMIRRELFGEQPAPRNLLTAIAASRST